MTESRLQHLIIGWLKDQNAYVIKTKPQPGIPTGCPDIIALHKNGWVAIEVKANSKSEFQTGQVATLRFLNTLSTQVYVAHEESWPEVKERLSKFFTQRTSA